MKLDHTLAQEIVKFTENDGSDEQIRAIRKQLKEVRREMSSPNAMRLYKDWVKEHGRVPVAICTACTILERMRRLNSWSIKWAIAVISCCRMNLNTRDFIIDDGLHPIRIEEYAGSFIRLTTEE